MQLWSAERSMSLLPEQFGGFSALLKGSGCAHDMYWHLSLYQTIFHQTIQSGLELGTLRLPAEVLTV